MRLFPLMFLGAGGIAMLLALGFWQLRRLDEKQTYIARIEAQMGATPEPLPVAAGPDNEFEAVRLTGTIGSGTLRFVHSADAYGLTVPVETDDRRIMVDLGLAPARDASEYTGTRIEITGNLAWPEGRGGALRTDQPNAWTQRNVPAMADALGTEPLLVVARSVTPDLPEVTPLPITTEGIPNNHLGYAIQWFAIAAAWAGMTVLLGWRMAGRTGRKG